MELYYAEDDAAVGDLVKEYLGRQGFSTRVLPTAAQARDALLARRPALLLIDWNLPDGQGLELCRWARARWAELPVLMLTVRDDTQDVVSGFQAGADDYVTKPFALEVLHSRIRALLRRAGGEADRTLSCDGLLLDPDQSRVFCRGEEVQLSQMEYRLLLLLLQNKGRNVPRERLLRQLWDDDGNYVNDNTLTVTVKRLREKLHQPRCLKTVRSFGYRIEDTL